MLPGCQWHTRPGGEITAVLVCCAMHGVKAHLEHALLPEGFNLRVRLVVCQPYATPGGTLVVRVRPARGGNSSENSPHYREAKKTTNVRDEIEKSFESKIRIFCASLAGSTSLCL